MGMCRRVCVYIGMYVCIYIHTYKEMEGCVKMGVFIIKYMFAIV